MRKKESLKKKKNLQKKKARKKCCKIQNSQWGRKKKEINFTIRPSALRRQDQNPKLPRVKEGQMRLTYWAQIRGRNTQGGIKADIHLQCLQNLCASQNTGDVALD